VIRLLIVAAWLGLLSLQLLLARSYFAYGTWWHYLLHQMVGWAAGLAVAALVTVFTRWRIPVIAALVGGQLASIVPDLLFRFQRMPHMPSMDLWLGHISIHTGPSPTLVTLGALLLAGGGWTAAAYLHRRTAVALAVSAGALVLLACLLAEPVPSTLEQFPTGPVSTFG
jgi:hypothetical protein